MLAGRARLAIFADLREEGGIGAAPAIGAAVDGDVDRVGIGAVAHPVAARAALDRHAQAAAVMAFACGRPAHRRRLLGYFDIVAAVGEDEVVAEGQVPERLGPDRAISALLGGKAG